LSFHPPSMMELPSPDSATEAPWTEAPTAPVPTSLLPCWVQTPVASREDPSRAGERVVATPAYDGRVAIVWQPDGALFGLPNRAGADQLRPLLDELRQCRGRLEKQAGYNQTYCPECNGAVPRQGTLLVMFPPSPACAVKRQSGTKRSDYLWRANKPIR
jgi:hypothetical protein